MTMFSRGNVLVSGGIVEGLWDERLPSARPTLPPHLCGEQSLVVTLKNGDRRVSKKDPERRLQLSAAQTTLQSVGHI